MSVGPASRPRFEALKISMLSNGLRASDRAIRHLGGSDAITVHEYATTGGIPLLIAGVDVNVPFDEWYCATAPVVLDLVDGQLVVEHDGAEWPVDAVHPLPDYYGELDSMGNRYDDVVFTHIERIRLSPIVGCAYDCAFCDLPGRLRLRPLSQLVEAADRALVDTRLAVRHALISGGSPGRRDEDDFLDILVALVQHLSPRLDVDVMMASSAKGPEAVRRLADAGVYGFALNLELESDDAAQLHIRGKHRRARPHFDATVGAAVELLGSTGRVRSLVLPGLEPVEATLQGVEHIAALGADPVLSPFRPARDTRLHEHRPVSEHVLRDVLDEARQIVRRRGVKLGPRCVPCQHNTLAFPWDVDAV